MRRRVTQQEMDAEAIMGLVIGSIPLAIALLLIWLC